MNYAADFQTFYKLLTKHWASNIHNIDVLKNLIGNDIIKNANNPKYELDKLILKNIDLGRNAKGEILNNAFLTISIQFQGILKSDELNIYNTNIAFQVRADDKSNSDYSMFSWHLDTEHPKIEDEFVHPLFHFHFGGKQMTDNEDFFYGNLLLLLSPRIMHPPLDFILAFDFIIHNFYSKKQRSPLVNDPDYIKIIPKIKKVCWHSYFSAAAENLNGQKQSGFYSGGEIFGLLK